MTAPILVTYATQHGSTGEVAVGIAARLRAEGLEVEIRACSDVADVTQYCGVVLGGALYTGRFHHDAVAFLRRFHAELALLPIAVFAMGPKTLNPADIASSRKQLERSLAKVPEISPHEIAIFGGVIDPKTLGFPFNHLHASDARDWDDIDRFALRCAAAYDYGKAAATLAEARSELPQTHR
jgi:menaquinone-dependent protoporphyrinogen oxidase